MTIIFHSIDNSIDDLFRELPLNNCILPFPLIQGSNGNHSVPPPAASAAAAVPTSAPAPAFLHPFTPAPAPAPAPAPTSASALLRPSTSAPAPAPVLLRPFAPAPTPHTSTLPPIPFTTASLPGRATRPSKRRDEENTKDPSYVPCLDQLDDFAGLPKESLRTVIRKFEKDYDLVSQQSSLDSALAYLKRLSVVNRVK